ncbi:hypothetical protein UlMin_005968 [Ulmus minor]
MNLKDSDKKILNKLTQKNLQTRKKRLGKKISSVWDHFTVLVGITKVFAITVDNASSNSVALVKVKECLQEKRHGIVLNGEMFHMRCYAYIVNLNVCDGLKEMGDSIASIRNAVRNVRSSLARLKQFKEASTEDNIASKALLCLDVITRWNSKYMMLEATLKFKKAFKNLEADANYTKYFDEEKVNGLIIDDPPRNLDWDQAFICQVSQDLL